MIYFLRTFRQSLRQGGLLRAIILTTILVVLFHWFWLQFENRNRWRPKTLVEKAAFATLLLPSNTSNSSSRDDDSDAYFLSTRILNYQLLHCKKTRTYRSIPFLILVTPDVPLTQRDKLQSEGATIVSVENLELSWMQPLNQRWRDVMAKLRLFQLTSYDRILFLDADTFLLKSLDGLFYDPVARPQKTLNVSKIEPDEALLPESYLFTALPEVTNKVHTYPPPNYPYFNAGFFLLSPSVGLFSYYVSLLDLPGRFDSTYPEQSLLNYAHREMGNMPWGRFHYEWNINLPNMVDVERGVASVHSKLWTLGNELQSTEPELRKMWRDTNEEMETFYAGVK